MDIIMVPKTYKRRLSHCLLFVFLLSACVSDTQKQYPFVYTGLIMGTSFSIKASQLSKKISVKDLQVLILARLEVINKRMSTYVEDSELSLLNQSQSITPHIISSELFTVLDAAEKMSVLSEGAFDITVGPLVRLWGFGPDKMRYQVPKDERIQALKKQIGYTKLSLNKEKLTVTKTVPRVAMDLSALAKGYAVDVVAELLESYGMIDYLVEIGGEIRLKGLNIKGHKWRIAIEKPTINKRELEKVIAITDIAMATSGDYRNFFEQNGQRFSHTIDPRTAYPVTHNLASVTVLAKSSMLADAWATAFMVLGSELGYIIAEKHHLAVFFIIKDAQGFVERATPLFLKYTEVKP